MNTSVLFREKSVAQPMNQFREKPERADPRAKHGSEKKSKKQSDSSGK
jgi:hypothetical protein